MIKFETFKILLIEKFGSAYSFIDRFDDNCTYEHSFEETIPTLNDEFLGKIIELDSEYNGSGVSRYFYSQKYNIYFEIVGDRYEDETDYNTEYFQCIPKYIIKKVYERK